MFSILSLCSTFALASGGPDAYGYSWSSVPFDFVAHPPTQPKLGLTDDSWTEVRLPWAFPFYDGTYDRVRVSDNGALRFGTEGTIGYSNWPLPFASNQGPDIAPLWDDLDPARTGAGVYAWNDAINSRFVIAWENVPHAVTGTSTVTFQVHLYPDGTVEFEYMDVDMGDATLTGGASATVGIQGNTGAENQSGGALQVSYNHASLSNYTAIAITRGAPTVPPPSDLDGDGDPDLTDCDPSDPTVWTAAPETADDGVDQDCNGADTVTCWVDMDLDGFGTTPTLDRDGNCDDDGKSDVSGDCDDLRDGVYPGAEEACDLSDSDCDGERVDGFPDADADGLPDCIDPVAPGGTPDTGSDDASGDDTADLEPVADTGDGLADEAFDEAFDDRPGCNGCSTGAPGGSGVAAAAAFALVGLVGRRRR